MIQKKTVLILGAGASYPYGFPLGRELLIDACRKLQDPRDAVTEIILSIGRFSTKDIGIFRSQLLMSHKNSIDAFLENRREFIELGKLVIAGCLIQKEKKDVLMERKKEQRWYNCLYQFLGDNLDEFRKNELSVITFNYDRSLEFFLFNALKASYETSDEDTAEVIKSIPIIHVYGQLAKPLFWDYTEGRNYDTDLIKGLVYAVKNIRIMSKGKSISPEFKHAVSLIQSADRLCFLGFGYHAMNIERLCLNSFRGAGKRIFGTVYGLGHAEVERSRKKLINLTELSSSHVTLADMSNLDLLRNYPIL